MMEQESRAVAAEARVVELEEQLAAERRGARAAQDEAATLRADLEISRKWEMAGAASVARVQQQVRQLPMMCHLQDVRPPVQSHCTCSLSTACIEMQQGHMHSPARSGSTLPIQVSCVLLTSPYRMLPQVLAAETAFHCSQSSAVHLHRHNLALGQQLGHTRMQLRAAQAQLGTNHEALTRANSRTAGLHTRNIQLQSETAAVRQRMETAEHMLATIDERERELDEKTSAAPEQQPSDARSEDVRAPSQTLPLADSGEAGFATANAPRDRAAALGDQEAQLSSVSPVTSSSEAASGERASVLQTSAAASPARADSHEVDAGHLMEPQAGTQSSVGAVQSPSRSGRGPAARFHSAESHPGNGGEAPADPVATESPLAQRADGQPVPAGEPVEAPHFMDSNLQNLTQTVAVTVRGDLHTDAKGEDAQLQHGAGAVRAAQQGSAVMTVHSRRAEPRWGCCGWLHGMATVARIVRRRCNSRTATSRHRLHAADLAAPRWEERRQEGSSTSA